MLSTTRLFVLVVIAFILIFVFVIGFNPFSFAQPYINRSLNPSPSILEVEPSVKPEADYIVLPDNTSPSTDTQINIDR